MRLTTKIFIGATFAIFSSVIAITFILSYLEKTKDESMYIGGIRIEHIDIDGINAIVLETDDENSYINSFIHIVGNENTKTLRVYEETYRAITSKETRGDTLLIKVTNDKSKRDALPSNIFYITLPVQSSFSLKNKMTYSYATIRDANLNRLDIEFDYAEYFFDIFNTKMDTLAVIYNNHISGQGGFKQMTSQDINIGFFTYSESEMVNGHLKRKEKCNVKELTGNSKDLIQDILYPELKQ